MTCNVLDTNVDVSDIRDAQIDPEKNVIIRGHVTWVGKTSFRVIMNVNQEVDGVWRKILDAKFLMVARDPQNKV